MSVAVCDNQELYATALCGLIGEGYLAQTVECHTGYAQLTESLARTGGVRMLVMNPATPGFAVETDLMVLRRTYPAMRILLCCATLTRQETFRLISCGAHGCVTKSQPRAEIAAAIRAVGNGGIYVPELVSDLEPEPSANASQLQKFPGIETGNRLIVARITHSDPSGLTEKQKVVLGLIARGLSNKAIAREMNLAEGTIKVHVNGVFKALRVNSRFQAMTAVNGRTGTAQFA